MTVDDGLRDAAWPGRRRPGDVERLALSIELGDLAGEDEVGVGVIDGQVQLGHR